MAYELARKKVQVFAFTGDVGSGKTLMAVAFALGLKRMVDADVYANIELYGEDFENYTRIGDTSFTDEVEADNRVKVVIIDEVGVAGRTVHSIAFSRVMILVRKLIGENSFIIMTTPELSQMDMALREMSDFLCIPEIYLDDGVPVAGKLDCFRKAKGVRGAFSARSFEVWSDLDLGVDLREVCNLYETKEVAEGLGRGTYKQIYKQFKDKIPYRISRGKRMVDLTVLTEMILSEFPQNVSKSSAKHWAECLKSGYDPFESETSKSTRPGTRDTGKTPGKRRGGMSR